MATTIITNGRSTEELTLKVTQLQDTVDRLEYKMDQNNKVLDTYVNRKLRKKAGDDDDGEENLERGNWSGHLDFMLSCLGYAVGLGNVWRFPYLAYKNGGGAFFIPYSIMLGIVGIPIFFLELSLGQFTSCGPATCWTFAKLFQGVGFAMVLVSAMVSIYYNLIIGWSFYYLFASFTDDLPWSKCRSDWASNLCGKETLNFTAATCETYNYVTASDGTCRMNFTDGEIIAIWNKSLAKTNGIQRVLESEDYLNREVLGVANSSGLGDIGGLRWQIVLCLLLAWIFVCLTLSKGIKTSGKVVYVTATFPYLVLVVLLIRGVLLDGYYDGIKFYITPDTDKLSDAQVWKDAAVQIFFSLSASWGGLIALSSYNKFHNDVFRDTLIVSFGNCLTSLFAGFVIFSFLGFLAQDLGEDIEDVAKKGPGLAFVVYPMAVTKLPISTLWAILFFVMLITLGVDSEFVLVETVTTSIMDVFPKTRQYKTFTVFLVGLVFFLLALPMCCDGGFYLFDLVDNYAGGWNVLVISFTECVAISYVYGIRRFLRDIETMVGKKVCYFMPWAFWRYWWAACWCFLTPVGVGFILVFSWVDYTRMDGYPWWGDLLGWLMTLTVVIAIFGTMLVYVYITPGTMAERVRYLTKPLPEWGPALTKHRALVAKYVPNYVVNIKDDPVVPDSIHVQVPKDTYYENHAMDMYESK